tara:strand:+ start:6705 stop:8030 length:1326 start_codon:yes stop_codon:yes gene_type:complete
MKLLSDKPKIIIVLSIWIFYIINILNYPLQFQHDTWLHHFELAKIMQFNFNDFKSEYGIPYYVFVSTFGIITYPMYFFDIIGLKEGLYLTIKLSNIFLVLITILIIIKFSEELISKKKDIIRFIPVLIFFALAPTERVFLMCRPETIMIPLTLISTYYFRKLFVGINLTNKHLLIFIISSVFLGLQKSTGFLFIIGMFGFALFFLKNLKNFPNYALTISFSIISYFFIHYILTGIPFYEIEEVRRNQMNITGFVNGNYSWEIFYKLNIIETFKYPVRDTISSIDRPFELSIPYIFLIDLFGDYFLYGKFRYLDRYTYFACVHYLNKASIFISLIFFISIFIISFKTFYTSIKIKNYNFNFFLNLQIYYGVFILSIATFLRMSPTGAVIKLDYIIFFLSLTCISFAEKLNNISIIQKRIIFLLSLILCFYSVEPFKCGLLIS